MPDPVTPVAAATPSTSKLLATVGRVVLLFCPRLWQGARPALVVNGWATQEQLDNGGVQLINANAMLDGANDAPALAEFRARPQGNTFTDVPLYNALTDTYRSQLNADHWAEWMPYQVGQAKKTEDLSTNVAAEVAKLREDLTKLAGGVDWSGTIGELQQTVELVDRRLAGFMKLTEDNLVGLSTAKAAATPVAVHPDGVIAAILHLAASAPETTEQVKKLLGMEPERSETAPVGG